MEQSSISENICIAIVWRFLANSAFFLYSKWHSTLLADLILLNKCTDDGEKTHYPNF